MKKIALTFTLALLTAASSMACGYGGFGINCRNYGELTIRDYNETQEHIFLGEVQRITDVGAMLLIVKKWKGTYEADTILVERSSWNRWNIDENLKAFKVGQEWLMFTSSQGSGTEMFECSRSSMRGSKKYKADLAFFNAIEATPNGEFKHLSSKGILTGIGNFKYGLPEGTWTYFDENGHAIAVANYENGVRHGRWSNLTPEGIKVLEIEYEDGQETYRLTSNASGVKYSEIIQTGDQKTYRNFHNNGNLSNETVQNISGATSVTRSYFENGRLRDERFYKNGARTGVWRTFNELGILTSKKNQSK